MAEPGVDKLIGVAEAIAILDATPVTPHITRLPLDRAMNLRLAQDVTADRDYPPFAKSLMDGYAVRASDLRGGVTQFHVIGEVAAGGVSEHALGPGETMAIMTGAPLPPGADGVVPVEEVEKHEESVRVLRAEGVTRFVAARGSDCAAGRVVLTRGTMLGPAQIAVAATVGAGELDVYEAPRVAVLGTGDELIPVGNSPQGFQIRNSNNPMLVSLLSRLGCHVTDLGAVRDEPEIIRAKLAEGLAHDALFVTGGMSMGEHDYVPRLLVELGVELKITKLRMKPGKPFVFGVGRGEEKPGEERHEGTEARRHEGGSDKATERRTNGGGADSRGAENLSSASSVPPSLRASVTSSFVFGLPGNPVSAFVCTVRLASRLLQRMAGGEVVENWVNGRLDTGLLPNGPREFYQPVIRTMAKARHSAQAPLPVIHPLTWKGSGDVFTLAAANALLVRGENEPSVPEGTLVRVLEI